MPEIKISKFEKYSNLNIVYELESDDYIINELLGSDDSGINNKRIIGYYLDINGEKKSIFIYSSNISGLILEFESSDFENKKLLSIDSIDVETIKTGVLYLVDRYKRFVSGEKIEIDKQEKNPEEEMKKIQLENAEKIKNIKNDIARMRLFPSLIKTNGVDEDKWALWLRKLDTIYLELEVLDIDLEKNLIKINFTDSYIEEALLIEKVISGDGTLDMKIFMNSI
ncbi:hypothetical protein HUU51_04270 [Candidatus Gracilibacteria bacterium]|nr:hypothetical protein [Candidatus Gracilibacteria bacterium]